MSYESWRISYQSSEAAARAAYATTEKLHAELTALRDQLAAIGAGGVEPLRKQAAPAALAVPMAEAWEQSAADTEHQRTGAGLHFNQGIAEGLRICAKDLRAALAAPAHPSEGMPEQTSRDAVIQHLTSAGVLEHDGCGIFIASGDASELIDACMAISATHPTQQGLDAVTPAARDVLAERQRQIETEGWKTERDDVYDTGEIALAAACYAAHSASCAAIKAPHTAPGVFVRTRSAQDFVGEMWPWSEDWWKPSGHRRNLEKAGALILAEIERIDRATLAAQAKHEVQP